MMAADVRYPLTNGAGVLKEQHAVELGRILMAHGNAYIAYTTGVA